MITIKVCGITNLEDAHLALDLGADYLGVIGYTRSPRAVSMDRARELCNSIPAGQRVFVDVNTPTHELENWADLGFDAFQIHCSYDCDLATVASWAGTVGADRLWLAPKWPPGEPFPETVFDFCQTVVVDAFHSSKWGGTGQTSDWTAFRELKNLYPRRRFFLAGGIGPQNIADAIRDSSAVCVDVNSGVEASPGRKDSAKLRELFQVCRK